MISRISLLARTVALTVGIVALAASTSFAQEGEPLVVDEVVAQINNDVITLSMVRRELKDAVDALKQQGKTDQEANDEIARRKPELIAALINEQLLLQQGKEMGLASEVEAEVNARMLDVAKQQGIKTIDGLNEALTASGLDPVAIRQSLRTELMKQAVLTRDVDARIFYGATMEELKAYFNAHLDKFRKPETVTLSEIFLSLAGKPEAEVKAKADQIVAQTRAGESFSTLAVTFSDRQINGKRVALDTKGEVGTFEIPSLNDRIAAAIKNIKEGGVSEPLRSDEGYQILRVDKRVAGGDAPVFNENKVREAITAERSPAERKAYLEKLRKDAYIKVSESYRESVMPFLVGTEATPASTTANVSDKNDKKTPKNSKP